MNLPRNRLKFLILALYYSTNLYGLDIEFNQNAYYTTSGMRTHVPNFNETIGIRIDASVQNFNERPKFKLWNLLSVEEYALQGDPKALTHLGEMYEKSIIDIDENKELIIQNYKQATGNENALLMYARLKMYNKELAIQYYERAAEKGEASSMYALLRIYSKEEDWREKEYYLNKIIKHIYSLHYLAMRRDRKAQYFMALLYYHETNDFGLTKDPKHYTFWMQKSAEQRYIPAVCAINEAYAKGYGGNLKYSIQAVSWLREYIELLTKDWVTPQREERS